MNETVVFICSNVSSNHYPVLLTNVLPTVVTENCFKGQGAKNKN